LFLISQRVSLNNSLHSSETAITKGGNFNFKAMTATAVKFDLCHFAGPKTMSGRGRQKGAKEQGCHATL